MSGFSSSIAVTNLNFRTPVDDIYHAFSQVGELVECRLILSERNESKGFAFLTYKRSRDANEAINRMNGFHLDGREIKVGWANTKYAQ